MDAPSFAKATEGRKFCKQNLRVGTKVAKWAAL